MRYRSALIFNVVLLITFVVTGCTSLYKTSHELFIDMMDDYIKLNKTLTELETFSGKGIANVEFKKEIVVLQNGDEEQHFALPNIYDGYCHYYLLIDKGTRKVKGWGFDLDKSNPRKNCGVSG